MFDDRPHITCNLSTETTTVRKLIYSVLEINALRAIFSTFSLRGRVFELISRLKMTAGGENDAKTEIVLIFDTTLFWVTQVGAKLKSLKI